MAVRPMNGASERVSSTQRKETQSAIMSSTNTLASYISKFADWPYQDPILAFPRDSYADFELFTAKEMNDLADTTAAYLISQGLNQLPEDESEVVALFGHGSAAYTTTFLALVKLGYTVFLLSPRLSIPTVVALLSKTHSSVVVHTADMKSKMEEIKGVQPVRTISMITRAELESCHPRTEAMVYDTNRWTNRSEIAIIWHSSGSTGIPKLFPMSHEAGMARLRSAVSNPYAGKPIFITSALYNSAGSTFALAALANSELTYYYNDHFPYTADGLTKFLVQARPQIVIAVPYALDQLASTPTGIQALKVCASVNSFGTVCPTQLGDKLVEEGVNLNSGYSMSETSTLMTSAFRNPKEDRAWDYMTPYAFTKNHIWMKPLGNDLYECVILAGLANCSRSNSDDPPRSFYTSDVFSKHPSLPDRWKLIGRQDDMINMSFAETFMALPFENHVKQHPLIEEAIVFGNGRPKLGLLVFASERAKDLTTKEIVVKIWPLVEEMNATNQPWTRISPVMVICVLFGESWPRTDKQNAIRPQVCRQYEQLINEKYDQPEESVLANSHKL